MSKPVDKVDFWKDRIEVAKKRNTLHHSVFIADRPLWNSISEKHKEILAKEVKLKDSVIDLGCGYGRGSEMVNCRKYIGVDFSPDFIDEAKVLYPDKEFMVADLKRLPFKDKEFDVGFMISIKAMIRSNLGDEVWSEMEKECKRVCKKVLVLEYGTGDAGIKNDADHYEVL